ncbi:MAG: PorT family protein [Bacteroidales bacterium]|nr:PorT family protein [Bacteroidales bacterium]
MKKTLTAVLVFLMMTTGPLLAQKRLYFGLSGTGLSSVIVNQNNYGLPFEMDYVLTFGGGGNANIGFDFNSHIGLKLEIGWAKLGQKYEDVHQDTSYTRNVKINYLQIPLLFKFRTGGDVAKFYIMTGPQLNILVSASQEYLKHENIWDENYTPGGWTKPIVIGESTITNRYNSMDIMARIDFGVDIQIIPNLFLNAGMTMAYGFLDINAPDWQMTNKDGNYNPSHNAYGGLTFGINYVLPVGGK